MLRSDPPSHPELLDHLAGEFIKSGWSIKALHRAHHALDDLPAAKSAAAYRGGRGRRITACCGDSIASGSTSRRCATPFWRSPARSGRTSAVQPSPIESPAFLSRRTLYGFIDRQNLDGVYRTFDFAVPDATSPRRFVTTVPQQALFLMNSPFLHEQARRLARRNPARAGPRCGDRTAEAVRGLYRRVLGRLPEKDELALATAFVLPSKPVEAKSASSTGGEPQLSPWEQLSQVLLLTNEFMFVD